MKKLIGLMVLSLLIGTAYACDEHGETGFMPDNTLYIGVDSKVRSDMTEKRFNEIIDKIEKVYKPVVRKKRGVLKVNRKWKNGTVNASASRFLWTWTVNMYGGLARHPDVTDDGFALVVCHELGHHLGGAPKYTSNGWASDEGQADYFGATKCFKRVYENDNNIRIVENMQVDEEATVKCTEAYTEPKDIALCERTAMAGKSLAKLLNRGRSVSFKTPDRNVVDETYHRHPAGQCRLDTYFHGGLCTKAWSDEVSPKNPEKGVCTRKAGFEIGVRPLCWYKPAE